MLFVDQRDCQRVYSIFCSSIEVCSDFNIQLFPIYQPPVNTKQERILSFICGSSSIPHIDKEIRGEQGEVFNSSFSSLIHRMPISPSIAPV